MIKGNLELYQAVYSSDFKDGRAAGRLDGTNWRVDRGRLDKKEGD